MQQEEDGAAYLPNYAPVKSCSRDNLTDVPPIINISDDSNLNPPVHIDEPPSTSGVDALLNTQVAPPSSPTIGLVSISKL